MATQKINFTRYRNYYDPQEVDAVIIELQRQIVDLKQQNTSLSDSVAKYDAKIREMAENTKRLQNERIQESLRMTGLMDTAAKIAEQTERESLAKAKEVAENARQETLKITETARREAGLVLETANREAENIRGRAQSDFVLIRSIFSKLSENTQILRQSNERYVSDANTRLAEIESLLSNALGGVPASTLSAFTPPILADSQAAIGSVSVSEADLDPYEDFVQKMKLSGE